MHITSTQNPTVKRVIKLHNNKRQRQNDQLMVVEGFDEITLAMQAGHLPESVFCAPDLTSRELPGLNSHAITVSKAVFEKMAYRQHPDGWLALFPIPQSSPDALNLPAAPLFIIAESVEKPGNLGVILRTADAVGANAVFICDRRVDVWSPNVVRASRGTIFSVPLFEMENEEALRWLRNHNISVLAATPSASTIYADVDLCKPIAVAVGTESEGLSDFWLSNAEERIVIPMAGKVNSLNVSVSLALIVYEAILQRRKL
ncbi:MAG: RNA methyltransferase [Deferribacteres bacterium]|nr:RNA methyltransferase [candidate division KSB1 bacterium]MCB9502573.1 RNA methyltransferase [Deferribacteres bacterium]